MRVLVVILTIAMAVMLLASTAAAFSMPFAIGSFGHHATLPSLMGSKKSLTSSPIGKGLSGSASGQKQNLKLPGLGSSLKPSGLSSKNTKSKSLLSGFGSSLMGAFGNPFSSTTSKSHGLSSILAGFPMLKK